MPDIGTTAFNAIYGAMPEARATATFGRTVVARCLCAGVGQTRNPTEIGAGIEYDVSLRILATDEPVKEAALGLTVFVTAYGESEPTKYRINGRYPRGGEVKFTLEYVHGQ
jgi:hypothetical protein